MTYNVLSGTLSLYNTTTTTTALHLCAFTTNRRWRNYVFWLSVCVCICPDKVYEQNISQTEGNFTKFMTLVHLRTKMNL